MYLSVKEEDVNAEMEEESAEEEEDVNAKMEEESAEEEEDVNAKMKRSAPRRKMKEKDEGEGRRRGGG